MNGRKVSSPEPDAALASRLAGGIWGHLVGDAVGVPYEFREASEIGEVRFGATGSHGQPPGTWSDDGALMLALLDSLLTAGFDVEDQGRRAVAWYRDGAYTPDGDGRFDVGLTTTAALSAIERGTPASGAGSTGEFDNGNGSLMRILPIALVDRDADDATLVDRAMRASRVTHGHPRAQVACALYVLVTARLLAGERDRAQALAGARASLRNVLGEQRNHLAALDHLEAYPERGGRGSVWDSFWSAWDAFEGALSYRETIERAVAYGNDTDTTAAIAGGLAGIYWGLEGIPQEWLAGMRGREVVEPLVAKLTEPLDPIRVDPVDLTGVPRLRSVNGRLGMTFTPGKRGPGVYVAYHRRNLADDVRWLRGAYAIDTFALLIEDHELDMLGVPDLPRSMADAGIELIRFPIVDVSVPDDREAVRVLLDELRDRLVDGKHVVVACRGGRGRTGIVVACLLIDGGLDPETAITHTRAARPGTIETSRQEAFVRSWVASPQRDGR